MAWCEPQSYLGAEFEIFIALDPESIQDRPNFREITPAHRVPASGGLGCSTAAFGPASIHAVGWFFDRLSSRVHARSVATVVLRSVPELPGDDSR